jgi:hypothetical protein
VADAHETPFNWAPVPPGLAPCWIDQVAPFHRSTSGSVAPPLPAKYPTAVHAVADAHETLVSCVWLEPFEVGVCCSDQVLPFQTSANGSVVAPVWVNEPTATHVEGDGHDTLAS